MGIKINRIFLLDPQARNGGSLSVYDSSLFCNFRSAEYTFFGNIDFGLNIHSDNVHFVPLFSYHKFKGSLRGFSYLNSMIRFLFAVLIHRPVCIHIFWIRLWIVDYIILWICKRVLNVFLVYTVHNVLPHSPHKYDVRHYRRLYSLMDSLIVHTEDSKRKLLGLSPTLICKEITVIPHGILKLKIDERMEEQVREQYRSRYDINDKIVFVMVGVQSRYKGTDLLLDAWCGSNFLSQDDNLLLMVMGQFSELTYPQEIPKNVIVEDRLLSEEEIVALMRLASVILLPYRDVEQSGVLMTVLREGTPYCATNVGELCKILETVDVGWCIGDPTIDNIRTKIEYIAAHRCEIAMKKQDIKAWKLIQETFNWEAISYKTESLYPLG